jgi:hypothetical protein
VDHAVAGFDVGYNDGRVVNFHTIVQIIDDVRLVANSMSNLLVLEPSHENSLEQAKP